MALLDYLETEERLSADFWVEADPFAREWSSEGQCAAQERCTSLWDLG